MTNNKLNDLIKLKQFCLDNINIDELDSKEAKSAFIRFISSIQDDIEKLELELGITSVEKIEKSVSNFKNKWNFPIGVFDKSKLLKFSDEDIIKISMYFLYDLAECGYLNDKGLNVLNNGILNMNDLKEFSANINVCLYELQEEGFVIQ